MEIKKSKRLQQIANRKDNDEVQEAADHSITLDVNDCDNIVGTEVSGIATGLELAAKAATMPGAEIFEINFDDYGDMDGVAIFVGTEDEVAAKLEALTNADEPRQDEEDEE